MSRAVRRRHAHRRPCRHRQHGENHVGWWDACEDSATETVCRATVFVRELTKTSWDRQRRTGAGTEPEADGSDRDTDTDRQGRTRQEKEVQTYKAPGRKTNSHRQTVHDRQKHWQGQLRSRVIFTHFYSIPASGFFRIDCCCPAFPKQSTPTTIPCTFSLPPSPSPLSESPSFLSQVPVEALHYLRSTSWLQAHLRQSA
jgi:hypothetical protein